MAIAWFSRGVSGGTVGANFVVDRVVDPTCWHCWFVAAAAVHKGELLWEHVVEVNEVPGVLVAKGHNDGKDWCLLIDQLRFIH